MTFKLGVLSLAWGPSESLLRECGQPKQYLRLLITQENVGNPLKPPS